MSFSFWALNLKGMLGLFSGESRCCEGAVRRLARYEGGGMGEFDIRRSRNRFGVRQRRGTGAAVVA